MQAESGAKEVQVAADSAPGSNCRNVFVEGDKQAYHRVKQLLQEIIDQQKRIKSAQSGRGGSDGPGTRVELIVPDTIVGLIIGKGGETIKGINRTSGAIVFIPKEIDPDAPHDRLVRISGHPD